MKQIIRALFHKYKPAFLYYRPVFIFSFSPVSNGRHGPVGVEP